MFIKVVRCYAELFEAWFNPAPKKILRQAQHDIEERLKKI
jgi:hypothetical protein